MTAKVVDLDAYRVQRDKAQHVGPDRLTAELKSWREVLMRPGVLIQVHNSMPFPSIRPGGADVHLLPMYDNSGFWVSQRFYDELQRKLPRA